MNEKYYSLTQLKSIMRTEGNQWTGPYDIIYPDDLKKLKPADVRPTDGGRWEDRCTAGIEETVCSECLHGGFHHFNFCPNCGADMTGGANNDG